MTTLCWLDLRGNRLTDIPEWIAELPALETLDLRWNPIEPGPRTLQQFRALAVLQARGCTVHY